MRRLLVIAAGLWMASGPAAAAPPPWKLDRVLVTFWSPPPATDAALKAVAADGYNLTWTPEAGLDVARRHGLKVMLQDDLLSPASLDDPAQRAKLDALVERVKVHPALEAYYLTDEPSAAAFPGLGRLVAHLRERDPAHVAYINLFPTYANNGQLGTAGDTETAYREHLRQFVETIKPALISYDHYHFFDTRDGDQYFLNLAMIRQTALGTGVPFLNIIQACTIEKVWRLVNADELRFLVYTTLAYGGRGISYFLHSGPVAYGGLYQDGVRMPLADAVAVLNREIASLSPALMHLDTVAVYHVGSLPREGEAIPRSSPVQVENNTGCVLGLFGSDGRPSAFMVVNRDYRHETVAKVSWPAAAGKVEEYDRTTSGWRSCEDWTQGERWSIPLRPGDGRLFRWSRE